MGKQKDFIAEIRFRPKNHNKGLTVSMLNRLEDYKIYDFCYLHHGWFCYRNNDRLYKDNEIDKVKDFVRSVCNTLKLDFDIVNIDNKAFIQELPSFETLGRLLGKKIDDLA